MTTREFPDDPDGQVLRRLADDGVDLNEFRDVDLSVWVRDRDQADQVIRLLEGKGYQFRVYQVRASGRWTMDCTRRMRLGYEAILAAQAELNSDLAALGLECDGWGTAS